MLSAILWALLGGGLIGAAASWLLLTEGRIAGISGILDGALDSPNEQTPWRVSFLLGLLSGGLLLSLFAPELIGAPDSRSVLSVCWAGLLVGYVTRRGSGCTSGHGVCGLTRLSPRSAAATLTFMATGFLTGTLLGWLGGGP